MAITISMAITMSMIINKWTTDFTEETEKREFF